jgi:hypothetical protein
MIALMIIEMLLFMVYEAQIKMCHSMAIKKPT